MTSQDVSQSITNNQPAISINPDLVWDYDIPPETQQSETFRCWYIARVLTRGQAKDIKTIGFDTIYKYLPSLNHSWVDSGRSRI